MKLGILVNTDRHLEHLKGLVKAARSKGHEVIIFIMDDGTNLLRDSYIDELGRTEGISVSYCCHNAKQRENDMPFISDSVISGSQMNNVEMYNDADRVIVL
jgi:predicted peroxiredoxin